MKGLRDSTKKEVESLLNTAPELIPTIDGILNSHFSSNTTQIQTQYTAALKPDPEAANTTLSSAIDEYTLALSETLSVIQKVERFITLHIPQMEDGNNFGVTVQMTISKALKEVRESLVKKMDFIPSYYNSRADLLDKFGLPKTVVSTTKTESKSDVKGGKDGDEAKQSCTEVTENKTTGSVLDLDRKLYNRFMALVKLDVNCYVNVRMGLVECRDSLTMILDNVEKNMEKLSSPKGSNGYGGNSMSMY